MHFKCIIKYIKEVKIYNFNSDRIYQIHFPNSL